MPSWVTLKLLGLLSGGLGLALAAAAAFGFIQTERLSAARLVIEARDTLIETLNQRIENDAVLIAGRDELIGQQNDAVLALAKAAEENRKAYQARLAKADATATSLRLRADDIMAQKIDTQDELERSRAALQLLVDNLGEEKP